MPLIPWDGSSSNRKPGQVKSPNNEDWLVLLAKIRDIVDYVNGIEFTNIQIGDALNSTFPLGSPITYDGQLASINNPNVIGLVSSEDCYIAVGYLVLDSWEEVSGNKLLISGAIYYLKEIGKLTVVPPTSGVLVEIGMAQTTTKMYINIKVPIYF